MSFPERIAFCYGSKSMLESGGKNRAREVIKENFWHEIAKFGGALCASRHHEMGTFARSLIGGIMRAAREEVPRPSRLAVVESIYRRH